MDAAKTIEQLKRQIKQKGQLLENANVECSKKVRTAQQEAKEAKEAKAKASALLAAKDADCDKKVRTAQQEAKEAKEAKAKASTLLAAKDADCDKKVRKAQQEAKEAKDNAAKLLSLKDADCAKNVRKAQKEAKEAKDSAAKLLSLKDADCDKKIRKAQQEAKAALSLKDGECSKKVQSAQKEASAAKEAAKQLSAKADELQRIQTYLASEDDTNALRTGSRVVVVGLSSINGKALNGSEGVILSELDLESGRFRVKVDGVGERSLKAENIVLHRAASGTTFMKVKEKFGAMVDGLRLKLRQQASELDHYKKQRHQDVKAKDDEIAALKKKCSSLESSVRQLQKQPPPSTSDDNVLEKCVKLMLNATPTDKASLRKLTLCLHPDKNPATSIATKMMQCLNNLMGY